MNWLRSRFRAFFGRKELDARMNEEMRSHIEMQTQENIASGMPPEEAVQAAHRQFGRVESIKHACREQRGVRWIENSIQDIRYGARRLRKSPGFAAVAILTLALGIGVNVGIFSVVDRLLVRPLPVEEPQKLAIIGQSRGGISVDFDFNYPLFRDYQRDNTVFSQLSATSEMDVGLGTGGATERQRAMVVSGNYFNMLGVAAAVGRTFAPNEGMEVDDAQVVVLSHGLWVRRFGSDPQVLGRSVTVNGHPFVIIGVAPREFTGTSRATTPDLYLPITTYGQLTKPVPSGENPLRTRFFTWLYMMGRLKEGVTRESAEAQINALARRIYAVTPANTATNLVVLPGALGLTEDLNESRLPLHLLFGAAGMILLIACANMANLQLARAAERTREVAVRLAIGASRGRIIRGLLTESFLLALCGGGVGMGVAFGLVRVLDSFRPSNIGVEIGGGLDVRALVFAVGVTLATGILFGLAPALRASRPELAPELKSGGGGAAGDRAGGGRFRGGLVISQIALSLLVLVGAGLCVRSLMKLQRLDPGFNPSQVALMSLNLGLNNYTNAQAQDFYDRLLERVRVLPGVEAASLSFTTPLNGRNPGMSVDRIDDYQSSPGERPSGEFNIVASDYFRALGVRMLHGRDFNSRDTANGPRVVIINEAFARRYWPGKDPTGKHINAFDPDGHGETEVIGVVESSRNRALSVSPRPAMFFPLSQRSDLALTLVVRTGLEPNATLAALRGVVRSMDAGVPVFGLRTLADQKSGSLALQRMAANLLGGFGFVALALAALGIYGVLAYNVGRRTREIGVRMALGARASDVLRLILSQGARLVAIGLVLGLGAGLGVARLLRGFLFEVQPMDPATFGGVIVLLAGVAALACWLPALRASRVQPMKALRAE